MASLTERFTGYKPLSYEVSVACVGGQFLIWDSANPGKVKPATTAHATNFLGMAKYDAAPGVEFGASTVAYQNVAINSPTPRIVAVCHMGVYDVVNAGDATLNPGDPVEIATTDGLPGKTGTGMVGGLAVVGICLGLVSNGVWAPKAVAAGATMRLRLGRV